MGGERASEMVVKGAAIAQQRFPHAEFLFYGVDERIRAHLAKLPKLAAHAIVHHTDEFITDDVKPSVALRGGRRSSMRLAIDAVAAGEADCVVSAGNTGALMAMAKFSLKMIPGIDRPAIASFFPTQRGESVMLDLGANVSCDSENLVQFALLGDVFTGNVALKTAEGTARLFAEFLHAAFTNSLAARFGYLFAWRSLAKLRKRMDPRRYNGAVFLGIQGICVKSHGSTDELGFASAIGVAADMAVNGFLDKVHDEM